MRSLPCSTFDFADCGAWAFDYAVRDGAVAKARTNADRL